MTGDQLAPTGMATLGATIRPFIRRNLFTSFASGMKFTSGKGKGKRGKGASERKSEIKRKKNSDRNKGGYTRSAEEYDANDDRRIQTSPLDGPACCRTRVYIYIFTAVSYDEQLEQMIVLPGHLTISAHDAPLLLLQMPRRSLRKVRDAPPPLPLRKSARLRDVFLFDPAVSTAFARAQLRIAATSVGPYGIASPARSPAAAKTAAISATRLDRRTTAVSNVRHVHTSRYHHSLSLRREKKKLRSYV